MRRSVRLGGNPQQKPVTVLQRSCQLELRDTPTAAVLEQSLRES